MYPHIQEAIARGEVLLEWDYSKGAPPKPLVKDVYGSERRKAKTLNFSIAYGKTIFGLAKDWGISKEEALETLNAWYKDRPEVRKWQQDTQAMAKRDGYVRTIMGRRRILKEANSHGPAGGHALRAAINTPIQGSAADVVMMAMIQLSRSEELKKIGWKLLLQIHDEVILEGPKESKDLAMKEVMRCMQNPFDGVGLMPLSVTLEVDAKTADTWYEAK
jgi:DNA polymerase I